MSAPGPLPRHPDALREWLTWLAAGTTAFAIALLWIPAAFVDGEFVPVGVDAFYHARRILETVRDPSAFYEFDPRIHAPEGSWLTWPWAFDLGIAWLVRGLVAVDPGLPAERALALVPALWVYLNAWLVLDVARRIGLGWPLRCLAAAAFAISPLTQNLHGVGRIDHHFAEQTFVLAALASALAWLERPASRGRAAACGFVLGLAQAFHNGLFLLQAPVLAALTLVAIRRLPPPASGVGPLAAGLLAGTLVAVGPSEPFREGLFTFYNLSWFHLYVAGASGAYLLALFRVPRSVAGVAGLALATAIVLAPVGHQVSLGFSFLGLEYTRLDRIEEMISMPTRLASGPEGWLFLWRTYSGLVALLPLVIGWAIWRAFRTRDQAELVFCVHAVFGIAMMLVEFRFHYFGAYALYLPWLLVAQRAWAARPHARRPLAAIAIAVTAVAYAPVPRQLATSQTPGNTLYYEFTRGLYPPLGKACREHPGVVLADFMDGHFITYHTACSVIANNFILTPQHHRKVQEADRLLALSARELVDQAPWIDYVLVSREDNVVAPPPPAAILAANAGLRRDLLFDDRPRPAEYELISETAFDYGGGRVTVVARAFRIERRAGGLP